MTETEWNACVTPYPLLEFLNGRASDRKLRLFACACCRRIGHLLTDPGAQAALETAERFADGLAGDADRSAARKAAQRAAQTRDVTARPTAPKWKRRAASTVYYAAARNAIPAWDKDAFPRTRAGHDDPCLQPPPGAPRSRPCQQFLCAHAGWFTTPLVLFEAKNILTRVYSVDPNTATTKLLQCAAGPLVLLDLDQATLAGAFQLADNHKLDLTDAVLLHLTRQHGAGHLATDDQRLVQASLHYGVAANSPLDVVLRQHVAVGEATNLPSKGLPRILRRVHQWLSQTHPQEAQDFWSQTGSTSHLR